MLYSKKYIIPLVLLFFSVIYFINSSSSSDLSTDFADPSGKKSWNQSLKAFFKSDVTSADITSADTSKKEAVVPTIREDLKKWVQGQSEQLEKPVKDSEAFKKQIELQMASLNFFEIKYIQNIVLDASQPMNKRIFSNYALTLLPVEPQIKVSEELVMAPLSVTENIKPHSEEEIRRGQELALKYMHIDRLFDLAQKGDDLALESLKKLESALTDEALRSYAQRKLKEIVR